MSESAVREMCPTCRTHLRAETLVCPACGSKVRYFAGQPLRVSRAPTPRTLAWGRARPHAVLHAIALGAALVALVLAAPTHLILGVLPCVAAIVALVARRPRHSDGQGSFAFRVWLRPTARVIAADTEPRANQRLLVTESPAANVFVLAIFGCVMWPIALLMLGSSTDTFARALTAQVIAWVGIAVAYIRMELRNKESEAQVVTGKHGA